MTEIEKVELIRFCITILEQHKSQYSKNSDLVGAASAMAQQIIDESKKLKL